MLREPSWFLPQPSCKSEGREAAKFSKHWNQNQANKNQRRLSFPRETIVGWCPNHKMNLLPGPPNASPAPKPVVTRRTGWDWETEFRATVRGVAVGVWGCPGNPATSERGSEQVPLPSLMLVRVTANVLRAESQGGYTWISNTDSRAGSVLKPQQQVSGGCGILPPVPSPLSLQGEDAHETQPGILNNSFKL